MGLVFVPVSPPRRADAAQPRKGRASPLPSGNSARMQPADAAAWAVDAMHRDAKPWTVTCRNGDLRELAHWLGDRSEFNACELSVEVYALAKLIELGRSAPRRLERLLRMQFAAQRQIEAPATTLRRRTTLRAALRVLAEREKWAHCMLAMTSSL